MAKKSKVSLTLRISEELLDTFTELSLRTDIPRNKLFNTCLKKYVQILDEKYSDF